jgi:hypothetical protein
MHLKDKEIREFEDKIGYKNIKANNIKIGEFLDFEPEIEYVVGNESGYCYSPKNVDYVFSDPQSQKRECEGWLANNVAKYPNGLAARNNYGVMQLKHFPKFHLDWNHLIEAINRLKQKQINISINTENIFETWLCVIANVINNFSNESKH